MQSSSSSNCAKKSIEVIFLGTGTSGSLPHLDCLTAPPDREPCRTCLSTLKPEGKHNIRRNTSVVLRISDEKEEGKKYTIVIDVGKNFQAAALEWFPKYGLRQIDAVLITHAHADAMNGLDDLRGWTLKGSIQSHIDVYVSHATLAEVNRAFPYMVSKEFASGGGDVPSFIWHIVEDKIPFEVRDTGVMVTPFSVHHGRLFTTNTPPACFPTPGGTGPNTPARTPPIQNSADFSENPMQTIYPCICWGFKIDDALVYLSDVSYIPDDSWRIIEPLTESLPVFILDCLHLTPHTSHYGLEQALTTARRAAARRTYLTGFSHNVSHDEYITLGEVIGGRAISDTNQLTEKEKEGLELIKPGPNIWLRPAHDGLKVSISGDGDVRDESYD